MESVSGLLNQFLNTINPVALFVLQTLEVKTTIPVWGILLIILISRHSFRPHHHIDE